MARLSDIAKVTQGVLHGEDSDFLGAVIDSRRCEQGQLFVALPGASVDGHAFVAAAAKAGAAGALVRELQDVDFPQIVVSDALEALQSYSVAHRQAFKGPVIGVTGTNGKTTTKEILASVLEHALGAPVLYTRGNLNNHIGVPLTLLGLDNQHAAAVIEMGANHSGEIAFLAGLAQPDTGIVTMAGAGHLEGFGSVEGVAHAKGEMFEALSADGAAVINADDDYAELWRGLAGDSRQLSFGLSADADVRAEFIRDEADCQCFSLVSPQGAADVRLPLSGRHNVMNALAAAAAALSIGVPVEKVADGLSAARTVGGRLTILEGPGGMRVVDDSYNANPTSVKAAIDWLAAQPGRHWLVLGDMAELGDDAEQWHAKVGAWSKACRPEQMFVLGDLSRATASEAGAVARHCASHEEIVEHLLAVIHSDGVADVTLLVKGSRYMQMEKVVAGLVEAGGDANGFPSTGGQVVNGG